MQIANSNMIIKENSKKNHNKIARKPVEKRVMYDVDTKANLYVFWNFIFI